MKARTVMLVLLSLALPSASAAERAERPFAANGRIVFVANGNGIASMNPDGSGVWGLMLGGADGEPAWSADGSRLALMVRWPGIEGITVMDPQPWSNRRRLTFSPSDRDPTWSPDGRTIAFSSSGDLALVPATGGDPAHLTTGAAYDTEPAWSPDGTTIAFTRQFDADGGIWTLDITTGAARRVASGAYAGAPSWSPSGELTYIDDQSALVRATDGSTSRLVAHVDQGSPIAWSPDGKHFLFVREGAIWISARAGGASTRLVPGYAPAWQPLAPGPPGCRLWGTESADVLVGTRGDDVICGLGGDDTVIGLDGGDLLRGGAGNDWVAGGQSRDTIFGDEGDDRLDSRDGADDFVHGGLGVDTGLLERNDLDRSLERRRLDGNLAAWRPVQASGLGIPDPPERVVDGRPDDYWNAGGWPPQWIEVDLLRATDIGTIRLVTGPQPAGVSHLVLGKGPATRGAYKLLRVVKGPTAAFQEVVLKPKRPWRGIRRLRIETIAGNQGAGWVSWHEIEVYAPPRRR